MPERSLLDTPEAPPPPGRRRARIFAWGLASLGGLVVLLVLLVLVSYKTFQYCFARLPDPIFTYQLDPSVRAQIPTWVSVEVDVGQTVPVKLSKVLNVEIPLRKDVEVHLDEDFTVPLDVSLAIPIDQEVYVEAQVPVETSRPLDGIRVQVDLWGVKKVSLPLSGSFPVKLTLPLRDVIRVKTEANIRLQELVTVRVNKRFTLPLDLSVKVDLPIDDVFDVDFSKRMTVNARVAEEIPVDVRMRLALSKEDGITTD